MEVEELSDDDEHHHHHDVDEKLTDTSRRRVSLLLLGGASRALDETAAELEQMKRIARSAKKEMLRKAARYRRKVPWRLPRGWRKRLALPFLLHAHKDGNRRQQREDR